MMFKVYIASALENAENVRLLRDLLRERGVELTYDWTVHGSVKDQGSARIREVARKKVEGVLGADLVVVLLPGGRGTHIELGIAIAAACGNYPMKIVICGQQADASGREPCFYELADLRWPWANPRRVFEALKENDLLPTPDARPM